MVTKVSNYVFLEIAKRIDFKCSHYKSMRGDRYIISLTQSFHNVYIYHKTSLYTINKHFHLSIKKRTKIGTWYTWWKDNFLICKYI